MPSCVNMPWCVCKALCERKEQYVCKAFYLQKPAY